MILGFLLVLIPHPHDGRMHTRVVRSPTECMAQANAAVNEYDYESAKCIALIPERDA